MTFSRIITDWKKRWPLVRTFLDAEPNSVWEKGYQWMRGDIDDALAEGILTPASDLRLNDDDEESYKKGLVFERTPDILPKKSRKGVNF